MAAGDITVFNDAKEWLCDGTHDLDGDTFKIGLITSAVTPADTTANPTWTTTFSGSQVATTADYVDGGNTLTVTWTESAGTVTWDATNDITWSQNAGGGSARWGIIYNDSDASKSCVAFLDLGGAIDMSAGDLSVTWDANGIFQLG
jgi:hypothetical protein